MKLTSHPTAARPAITLPTAARIVVMALAIPLLVACQPEKGKDESGAVEETPPAPAPVDPAPPESHGEEKVDELTLKRLLCTAAAMDRKPWEEIAVKGNIDLEAIRDDSEEDGWVITAFVLAEENLRIERENPEGPWKRVAK